MNISENTQIVIDIIDNDRPIKIIYEDEYPCTVAYQLGFNHHCKYVDVTSKEFEMSFTCNNIGCKECFLEEKTK